MVKTKSTKRALLMSALSLLLCVSMLIGTTFAWFTDSVTSGRNTIQSGNLDVELWYSVYKDGAWTTYAEVTENTKVFDYDLWEPGYTAVAKFKVVNAGSLALKYQLTADVYAETPGVNVAGETFLLSKSLKYGVTTTVADLTTREKAVAVADNDFGSFELNALSLAAKSETEVGMVIAMPTTVGNEANHKTSDEAGNPGKYQPKIEFGINLVATQDTVESDSFDNRYDKDADYAIEVADEASLKNALAIGGKVKLTQGIALSETVNIPVGTVVTLDMNGNDISYNQASGIALYSEGDLTLTGDGTIESAASAYAVRVQRGSLTINSANIAVKGAFGAISVFNGANVTINGGSYSNTGVAGKTSHVVYLGGYGTITINDGSFVRGADGDSGGVIVGYGWSNDANEKAIINIKGGYIASETAWGFISNYNGAWTDIVATGGTYNRNPSAYVAPGYQVTNNGDGTWTVERSKASTGADLSAAINSGKAVELTDDVTFNAAIKKDANIDLAGNTFEATGTINLGNNADLTMTGGDYAVNGTYGHIDVRPSTAEGSVVTFEDVNFSYNKLSNSNGPSTNRLGSVVEVCATATGAKSVVVFKNCTFTNAQVLLEGLSGTVGEVDVTFENCTFNALTSSAPIYVQNYVKGTVNVVGCTFNLECTSSTASAIYVSSSSSTSIVVNAENNTINAKVATPYTFDAAKGEDSTYNVKVNGTPANVKFISSYSNTTVNEIGTVKSGIAI